MKEQIQKWIDAVIAEQAGGLKEGLNAVLTEKSLIAMEAKKAEVAEKYFGQAQDIEESLDEESAAEMRKRHKSEYRKTYNGYMAGMATDDDLERVSKRHKEERRQTKNEEVDSNGE